MFEKTYKHKGQDITIKVNRHSITAHHADGRQITKDKYNENHGIGWWMVIVANRFFENIVKLLL